MPGDASPSDAFPAPSSMAVDGNCPSCSEPTLAMTTLTHDVPHFGATLQTLVRCSGCGFRFVDFLVVQEKEPVRYTLALSDEADLRARVIRSASGTIRIPELGFAAEPTAQSESYVSNIEGVLERIEDVFQMARRFNLDNPDMVAIADKGLASLADARAGNGGITLVIEDPWGNSAIVSDSASREALTKEEAEALHTGIIVIDKSELASGGDPAEGGGDGDGGADLGIEP